MKSESTVELPVSSGLRRIQILSALATLLMAGLSIIGLALFEKLYPTQEFVQSFMTNDIVNLAIGVPILIIALLLIRRKKVTGLLLLPGALLYVIYNSLAYVFGRPFDLYSVGHLALILVCAYGIFFTLSNMDREAIHEKLVGVIPAKFSGWVLTGFGTLFFFRAAGIFASSLIQSTAIPVSEVGVLVADMILSILLVTGGVLLLRSRALGAAAGLGLLYAASMLFVGLIVLMGIQAELNQTAFPFVDILVVALMGSVCFVPFVKYLRAASSPKFL